jgi:hypothetical protein
MQELSPYEARQLRRKYLFPHIRKYLRDCVAPTIGTFRPEDVDAIWTDDHLESVRKSGQRFFYSLVAKAIEYRDTTRRSYP